jgi:pyrroline-5-carboxylate reductase
MATDPSNQPAVVLIGGGRMGGAILRGLKDGPAREIFVVDPNIAAAPGATLVRSPAELPALSAPTVVVAVKPQMLGAALPGLKPLAQARALFISIVAGVTFASFRAALGDDVQIVRAMPNTPAGVLKGISGAVAAPAVDAQGRARTDALLRAIGDVVWLDDETMIDLVTAISGSGPAYFFRFAEVLADAGRALGLSDEVAERLARRTLEGAGALAASTDRSLADLRVEVTSPKGTTAAALERFDHDARLQKLVNEAANAAAERSRELGRGG